MVTNIEENMKKKCEKYWPESGCVKYGPFSLNLIQKQTFADYVSRTILLSVSTVDSGDPSVGTPRWGPLGGDPSVGTLRWGTVWGQVNRVPIREASPFQGCLNILNWVPTKVSLNVEMSILMGISS